MNCALLSGPLVMEATSAPPDHVSSASSIQRQASNPADRMRVFGGYIPILVEASWSRFQVTETPPSIRKCVGPRLAGLVSHSAQDVSFFLLFIYKAFSYFPRLCASRGRSPFVKSPTTEH